MNRATHLVRLGGTLLTLAFLYSFFFLSGTTARALDDLVTTLQASGRCHTLLKIIQLTGRDRVLERSGPFTIFAPTDEAFAKLPGGVLEGLMKPTNKAGLQSILETHLIKGKLTSQDARTATITTVGGSKVEIDRDNSAFVFEDANVVQPDIAARNGVIQIIDKVILPSQADTLASMPTPAPKGKKRSKKTE
jgi:uncharacterized surface protein with fasciclin (FAS1) repeats